MRPSNHHPLTKPCNATQPRRRLTSFEGRSSVRAWLHRIAVNGCLNALRDRSRRPREVPMMAQPLEPTRLADPVWVEPYPDVLLDGVPDIAPGPEARYDTKESIELTFITALQHLPPRQRAILVLRDVLGYRAAEVAGMLGTTEASVKGALQRARAALQARLPAGRDRAPLPDSPRERHLAGRFAAAIEDPARRPDQRHHLVLRQQRLPPLRAPPRTAPVGRDAGR
jgi:RNA polymerase sigma-70 factor (TIGR02960 family)